MNSGLKKYGLILLSWLPLMLWAQATNMPYSCGFEEGEDLSVWTFNANTSTATDQWSLSSVTHSEGKRSLLISTNGGQDYVRGAKPNIVVSYLSFKFPTQTKQKDYDLSFDWKCEGDPNTSMLYVMVCPEQFFLTKTTGAEAYYIGNIASATNGVLPLATQNVCSKIGAANSSYLNGSSEWQNTSLNQDIRISSSNSKRNWVIAFIWVNNNRDTTTYHSGACIDNIQLASATIKKPTDLKVSPVCGDSTMHVTWESQSNYHVVEYRKQGTNTWRRADGLTAGAQFFTQNGTQCSYDIQRVLEGSYDVRVKSALVTTTVSDTSAYTTISNVLMYCPDNHCINYLVLDNPNVVCTYGYTEDANKVDKTTGQHLTPYSYSGYISIPDDRKMSRHTIMTDLNEVDPNTDSLLHCVPTGELGSVRLGNWNTGSEAESMTYTFSVDSMNASILLVKYACVLNKPNPNCGDPGFKMEILDEYGDPIDQLCGVPDFTYTSASTAETGWNTTANGNVVWRDWTTVGVNLQSYSGQNIKVRMTTRDCGGGGHFGYAYFILDCASAYIETENCGNDSKIICSAPEGFAYKWTDETGKEVSRLGTLEVDAGIHTYTCRVSFIEDSTCYFEVSTVSAPRFPVPQFDYTINPGECLNRVFFTNKSHVMNKYSGYENHTSETCTDQHWYFTRLSDGSTTETTNYGPMYVAPAEGDSILVRLTAYIGEANACDSTIDTVIYVPGIIDRDSVAYLTLCEGEPFAFDGTHLSATKDSTYIVTTPNSAGCDSTFTLHLHVNPKTPELFRHDSICSDSSIVIGNQTFATSGHYSVFMQNRFGCDSIITTDLFVNQRIGVTMESGGSFDVCSDNAQLDIDYSILEGQYDSVRVRFSEAAHNVGFRDTTVTDPALTSIAIPYSASTLPGVYTATVDFLQSCCRTTRLNISFTIHYYSAIVEQKWNDVLTVLSPKYNGGYSFTAFQWYKNGQPIAGATKSYLYETLDTNASYYVVLTRGDNVSVASCPMTPAVHQDKTSFPTVVKIAQRVPTRLDSNAQIRFYTITGQLYSDSSFPAGDVSVAAPGQQGIYIVEIIPSSGDRQTQHVIVR